MSWYFHNKIPLFSNVVDHGLIFYYLYIYIYKTETSGTPTIFHVTTIFFFLFILDSFYFRFYIRRVPSQFYKILSLETLKPHTQNQTVIESLSKSSTRPLSVSLNLKLATSTRLRAWTWEIRGWSNCKGLTLLGIKLRWISSGVLSELRGFFALLYRRVTDFEK